MSQYKNQHVIAVDLDGTLLRSDLLYECIARLLRHRAWMLLWVPFWLLRGIVYLKWQLAKHTVDYIDFAALPLNEPLLKWLRQQTMPVVLISASHQILVDRIAQQIGGFALAVGTTDVNMQGGQKVVWLQQHTQAFDYIGNSKADVPTWQAAQQAYSCGYLPNKKIMPLAQWQSNTFGALLSAIRWHQWAKNALLFVPLVLGFRFFSEQVFYSAIVAFISFCFLASSMYLLNDILDLDSDRNHPEKRHRGLASGMVSIPVASILGGALFVVSMALALMVNTMFLWVALLYMFIALAYSFALKKVVMLDVIVLSILYTIRIIAGSAATGIVTSNWLIAFSVALFFSLACLKRFSDLVVTSKALSGRGYSLQDVPVLQMLGIGGALLSVLIAALYINSLEAELNYQSSPWLWGVNIVLLYWVSMMWLRANRQEIKIDPVLYAIKDKVSWLCILSIACFLALIVL